MLKYSRHLVTIDAPRAQGIYSNGQVVGVVTALFLSIESKRYIGVSGVTSDRNLSTISCYEVTR